MCRWFFMGWFADFRFANHNVVVDSWTPRKDILISYENSKKIRLSVGGGGGGAVPCKFVPLWQWGGKWNHCRDSNSARADGLPATDGDLAMQPPSERGNIATAPLHNSTGLCSFIRAALRFPDEQLHCILFMESGSVRWTGKTARGNIPLARRTHECTT